MQIIEHEKYKACVSEQFTNEMLKEAIKKLEDFSVQEKSLPDVDSFGRSKILRYTVEGLSCVLRLYWRGGVIGKFNKRQFIKPLKKNSYRPFKEFQVLKRLESAGIKVPSPLAAIVTPQYLAFYQGAIVMRELKNSENLLALFLSEVSKQLTGTKNVEYSYLTGREAKKALELGIQHTDLHPGNVLVRANTVYLIDFDKSVETPLDSNSQQKSKSFLTARWERSVLKQFGKTRFSTQVVEAFNSGLYK